MPRKKLRSSRGETLAEVLISIVICCVAILMLATMLTVSMGINQRAREMDVAFYDDLSDVEAHFTDGDTPCAVTVRGESAPEITFSDARSYTPEDGAGLTVYGKGVTP